MRKIEYKNNVIKKISFHSTLSLFILLFNLTFYTANSQQKNNSNLHLTLTDVRKSGLPLVENHSYFNSSPQNFIFDSDSIQFNHFDTNDGLSQVTINDIIQDTYGFIWIATQDGLNRFDGEKFKHYKPIEKDSTTIPGRYVEKLLQDDNGNIWIGTEAKGLCYYDRTLEKFHRVALETLQEHSEVITDLTEDKSGNIWVLSGISGLFRLNLKKDNSISSKKIFSSKHSLSALYVDHQNDLWVGNWEGRIFKFRDLEKDIPIQSVGLQVKGAVRSFYRMKNDLLIGTDFGLYKYNLESKEIKQIELGTINNSEIKFIKEILPNNDTKTCWIATGDGLLLFDIETLEVLRKISIAEDNKDGLSSGTIHSLLHLANNSLVVGTANGLDILDFNEPVFNNLSRNNLGDHVLNGNVVFSILKDAKDLWIGTSDGGLNLIRNGKSHYFKENQNDPKSIAGNVIRSIVKDTINNRLWFGTTRGLSMIDLNTFLVEKPEFKVFQYEENNPNSIPENFIRDITLDNNNNLWGATFSKGVFKVEMSLNGQEVNFIRYVHENDDSNSIINNLTSVIRVDTSNTIWIGTREGLS